MHSFLQDVRYAFQQARKNPGFNATAIISLALGIAATTAVFSVVYGVLMNPYPYADADRMVHLIVKDTAGDDRWIFLTGSQIQQLRQASFLASVAAQDDWSLTTTGEDVPENVDAVFLTGNAMAHLGVPALIGRGLIPSDAPEGKDPEPVAVLLYTFWQRHFNGRPDIVGRTIQLAHKTYTIVGVMPPRFTWGGPDAGVYLPLKLTSDPVHTFYPFIKLKPGVTHEAANAQFQAILQQFAKQTPTHFPKKFRVQVQGLNDQFVKRLGVTLALLFGAVALLLVIGCANVSILLLARGTARQHELAVRAAMGASRYRIVRQLLTESIALSLAGAGLGVLLAYRTVTLIVRWLPEDSFPKEAAIQVDLHVLIFSVALALLTGIGFGLSPALQFSRPELAQIMQASMRRVIGGVRGRRTHNLLVAGQLALTLLLLTAAGSAMAGFIRLAHTQLGYDPHNTMSVGIPVHDNTYTTWQARSQYFTALLERIAAMPEVVSAGISTNATPPNNGWNNTFEIFGRPKLEQSNLRLNLISPEYLNVLHIPLERGRVWDHAETVRGAHLALINETMARQFWPNGDAIGRQIRFPELKPEPPYGLTVPGSDSWVQIIGVVADARDDGLRNAVKPAAYVPYTFALRMWTQILVRTRVPPLSILHAVRERIRDVNPDQQVFSDIRDLDHWITREPEWAQERLVTILFGAFSVLALLLAAVGLYSVVAYSLAQRTNEFGIRMALGAQRRDVLRDVFSSTAVSIGGGLAAGLLLSVLFNGVVAHWIEGGSRNPLIIFAVMSLLMAVALVACFVPARRASRIEPMAALRYE
ncbi:MAG TPA: ABC transporter permease [Bryobacteraceae bacterium]|nr:ABC transporter permease [Bryobacteraceae bacterium]